MEYASIFAAVVIGYLALGFMYLIFSVVQEEKLLRYRNNDQLPQEVIEHMKIAPSITKRIVLWPKALKWLTRLEDLLNKPHLH